MTKFTLHIACILLLFSANSLLAQQKRTVDFVGGARSFISNNQINVQDSLPDTTTIKRNTGGYALVDLGVNIRPNKSTEIMGMFRIRNEYGGFWGAGVTFGVRQLWLKGVIGNAVRYQIGDLNLKQTAFTLYNHHADRMDSLPAIFGLQNQIISYEKFYQKNTWRQQGASVDFGLKFKKYIQEINFNGYLTRLGATNFSTVPDRLMGGGTVQLVQSKHIAVGYNLFSVFDVKGTVLDSNTFTNNVHTLNLAYVTKIKDNRLEIKAEGGQSAAQYAQKIEASSLKDYFLHGYAKFIMPKQHVDFSVGYLNVGPDFRSIGAQSKNVNYDAIPNFYNRYTNAQITRTPSLLDFIRNDNMYNVGVSSKLMAINPIYNNVLPYGLATFNRVGAIAKVSYASPKGITLNAEHDNLSEVRGQGTFNLKHFTQTKVNAILEINKLANFKKILKVQAGANYQTTLRNSSLDIEKVDLTSLQYSAGLEYEVVPKIDVLAGFVSIAAKGNDFMPERDEYSKVTYYNNINYDLTQQISAFGARCRFNEKIYLCALYQMSNYADKLKVNPNYKINQFAVIYNMTF